MNNLTPIPPHDPGFQLAAPIDAHAATPPPKLRVKKFLFFLRKFWWIPLVTLTLATVVAVVNFLHLPPEFIALGKMWETERLQLPDGVSFAEDQENYYGTMTAVLQSDPLRQLALAALPTNAIVLGKDGNPLSVQISVLQQPRSAVFFVQADGANPAFTPAYLNSLMNAYLDYKKDVRKQVSGDTMSSISDQISQLEQEMKSDQEILAQYEQSNNIVLLEQDMQVSAGYLAKLKTQLADYQLQNKLLDAVTLEKNSVPTLGMTNMASPLFENLQGGATPLSPALQSQNTYQQIESLKYQRDKLSKYLRPAHPKIVKLNEQIKDAENQVDIDRRLNQQEIATTRQSYQIRIDNIQEEIKQYEKTVSDDNARIAQANILRDNISSNKGEYDKLVGLMGNVDLSRNIDQDTLAILQPASGSSRSYTKLKSNLSTSSMGGLALGLAIVLLIAIRDDRFTSVVEVAERIGDNIVGQVPDMERLGNGAPLALLGNNDDRHMYVESYRNLRSALLYLAVNGSRPKLLLITSAVPNEGKSTIASNLARIMALGGSRVLLIDGDLRRGHLHDLFELKAKPGLAELLLHSEVENLDKFIQPSNIPNLSIIARGSGQQNPGDLFLKDAFDSMLARLREQYDYVILDSSPVFAADDSTTLAPKMDGTLFVVRNRFSRSNVVKEALELLYQRQAIVLGLILNRMDASGRSYHYYKYSEYHSSTETT